MTAPALATAPRTADPATGAVRRGPGRSGPAGPRARRPGRRGRVAARAVRGLVWAVVVLCVTAFAASLAVPWWFGLQGQRLLIVTSGSMAPLLRTGDAAVMQTIEDPSQLRVGQIASFWPPGGDHLVTHRIVDLRMLPDLVPDPATGEMEPRRDERSGEVVERPYIVTRGDANDADDPNATPLSRVRGIVLDVRPGWGRVLGWAHSPQGRWAMLAPPLALVAALEITDTLAERRRRARSAAATREEGRLDALLLG